ncbi:MAG: hypothetical protein M0Z28_16115 [Rhodospirillales bacterium]|nr:hypothetical protein [Rhodospirillales bacterium]
MLAAVFLLLIATSAHDSASHIVQNSTSALFAVLSAFSGDVSALFGRVEADIGKTVTITAAAAAHARTG